MSPGHDRHNNKRSPSSVRHTVKLPRRRIRRVAKYLLDIGDTPPSDPETSQQSRTGDSHIEFVCIADTHNLQPVIPPGDILIHAGDLSEWGSFDEIQTQLTWLASHPHSHKIVIAGNHDVLLDPAFLASHPDTYPVAPRKTAQDLDFHDLIYLENSSVELHLPSRDGRAPATRTVRVWGSPLTPQYGDSAFQYSRDENVWEKMDWTGVDVLVTHGPLWGHLDGFRRAGCRFLGDKVSRAEGLKLHVCGHIHVGAGEEGVRFDGVRRAFAEVESGSRGWEVIPGMAFRAVLTRVGAHLGMYGDRRKTQLVNASIKREDGGHREPVVVCV